jgi:hypothetical protein
MVPLASLWLPIVLSSVAVFLASSLLHMVLRYHQTDFARLPNEDAVMDALRPAPSGDYLAPFAANAAERKNPAFVERMKRGPIVVLTVMGEGMATSFPKILVKWFLYSVAVSVFAAYLGGRALSPGAESSEVVRFTATTAFLGYAMAMMQQSIWWGKKWSATLKSMLDGLIYGLITGAVFAWLWPK